MSMFLQGLGCDLEICHLMEQLTPNNLCPRVTCRSSVHNSERTQSLIKPPLLVSEYGSRKSVDQWSWNWAMTRCADSIRQRGNSGWAKGWKQLSSLTLWRVSDLEPVWTLSTHPWHRYEIRCLNSHAWYFKSVNQLYNGENVREAKQITLKGKSLYGQRLDTKRKKWYVILDAIILYDLQYKYVKVLM